MTIPSQSLYPGEIDSDASLFANPVNGVTLTLKSSLSSSATAVEIIEDLSAIGVPCFLSFESGEVVYAESKDAGTRTVFVLRGASPSSHVAGEKIRPAVAAEYFNQLKRAILAIENTLGVNPHGSYQNVSERLSEIEVVAASALSEATAANSQIQYLTEAKSEIEDLANDAANLSQEITDLHSSISANQQILNADIAELNNAILSGDGIPVGSVMTWIKETPPAGYLVCNGAAISRTTYQNLFNAIGVTFGAGNGSTTFNIPDIRGRTPIGTGTEDQSLSSRSLGAKLGERSHKLLITEMPSHQHTYSRGTSGRGYEDGYQDTVGTLGTANTSYVGADLEHENMQPSIALVFIIKY